MRFVVGHRERDESTVPARLGEVEPLRRSAASRVRSFRFRRGAVNGVRGWTINDQPFDPTRVDAQPRLGDVGIWRFTTDFHHPVHLHLVPFQVLSRNGREPLDRDAGWKDTVDLEVYDQVEVIVRFTSYRGRYVFHCHNLEHEDMAMMANFETT